MWSNHGRRVCLALITVSFLTILGARVLEAQGPPAGLHAVDPGPGVTIRDASPPLPIVKTGRYIVRLAEPPLASYRGGIAGLAPTSPAVRGVQHLNVAATPERAYATYLGRRQGEVEAGIVAAIGRPLQVDRRYHVAFNGFVAPMTALEAARAAKVPGVAAVTPELMRFIQTDAGPEWIGAPSLWDGTATGGLPGTKGEEIVIGVVDSGINPDHPSFAAVGPVDGYTHSNPRGTYFGVCDPASGVYDASFPCNEKLIGAWNYADGPEDTNGHGTHTTSTAAGNALSSLALVAPTITMYFDISGVAPHANIIAYDVCGASGSCALGAILAGIDQAVADGVDVINYSIGGGSSDPWTDDDSLAYLSAMDAGIFVASSAGNSGPGSGTVGSPAEAPWIAAAAAATHNRHLFNTLGGMSGGGTTPPDPITGKSVTEGYGPAQIVYAGDYGDALCLSPFAPGTFSGQIVVCDRGTNARVEKGTNVQDGGAGAMVLANALADGESVSADLHVLPAVHIGYNEGVELKAWLASGSGHQGTISGTSAVHDASQADVLAGFSSRGPSPSVPSIIKPDITAPGVDIIAADGLSLNANILSGTSMASPHLAGAGILLRALHPSWTPAEIRSALMGTADTGIIKEDGATPATPFDQGAGRVDLTKAGRSGLVMDETTANFTAADPSSGGDPTQLNLPSLADDVCVGSCTWTRTFTNTLAVPASWGASASSDSPAVMGLSVAPSTLTLAPGASGSIQVTADTALGTPDTWYFGQVDLVELGSQAPAFHLPVAVRPQASSDFGLLTKSADKASATAGEVVTYTIDLTNGTGATTFSLQDPIPANSIYVPGSASCLVDGSPCTITHDSGSNRVTASGAIALPGIEVLAGSSPGGYVSLSDLGVGPLGCPSNCDEGGYIFSGLDFTYNGHHYDSFIVSVNGTIEPGSASMLSAGYMNLPLPDATLPNNLLAPFWTDLDMTSSGNWYQATLTNGVDSWYVVEWEDAPEWNQSGTAHTFQVWIGKGATEGIHFVYEQFSPGLPDAVTVGAENDDGTIGDTYYYNGSGTAPAVGTDLVVGTGTGGSGTFSFQVQVGSGPQHVVNVAEATLGSATVEATATTVVNAACLPPVDRTVAHYTVSGTETMTACGTLTVESSEVTASGDANLCAGAGIVLGDGFAVGAGGTLKAQVDPTLGCH